MKTLKWLSALVLALPGAAFASDDGSFAASIGGGLLVTDPLEVMGSSYTVVPRFGYWYSPVLGVELDVGFSTGQTRVGIPETFGYTSIVPRLNVVGRTFEDQPINLIMAVGIGGWTKSIKDDGALALPVGTKMDLDFVGNAGPGLLVPLGDVVALRTDLRFLLSLGGENYQNRGDAFLSWEWSTGFAFGIPTKKDSDKDGIVDADDKCPNEAEDKDGTDDIDGCPDPDNDQDGILDTADTCPNEAEDLDEFNDSDGCPDPDNDEDGLADGADDCPNEAGPEATTGCPDTDEDGIADKVDECEGEAGTKNSFGCPDKDEDRVPDYRDECPEEAGPPKADPRRADGCPSVAYFAEGALVITEKVEFDTGKNTIKATSEPLLKKIAELLNRFPKVTKVQIEGYTDSDGDDKKNLDLSQARAEAVKTWLTEKGAVDAGRLVAKGFGEENPAVPNDTAENKALNRRVEFKILEQEEINPRKQKGGAGGGGKGKKDDGAEGGSAPAPAPTESEDG